MHVRTVTPSFSPAHLIECPHDCEQNNEEAQHAQLDACAHTGSQQHALLGWPEHISVHQLPPRLLVQVALEALQVTILLGVPGSKGKQSHQLGC